MNIAACSPKASSRIASVLLAFSFCGAPLARAADDGDGPLLHAMFQDHAVLQRDRPIRIWGQARPGEEVRVALGGARARGRADEGGRWEVRLPALAAGGPHTLVAAASGGATQTVDDVLVGDVWLCSGQSNIVLQVHRTLDSRAEIAGADNDAIRMLTVGEAGSAVPLETFATPVRWLKTHPDTVRDFSATCYYFARELQKRVDVPMGLISAAWGGSRIQAWTSADALRATGEYDGELDVLALYADDPAAAVGRWGDLWAEWWRGRSDVAMGDEPWSPDAAPAGDWHDAPRELGAWERWGVPELAAFDGMVWYRTTVTLTARQAAQGAVLALGPADEMDMTWVNGRAVGSTYGAGDAREYRLPPGLLREGDNVVVVNVLDTYRDGGLAGPASRHALRFEDGSGVALDGTWRYRVVPGVDWPPRAPWQSAAGLSTLYNGMIAPIGRYDLRGIVWYQGESNTFEADRYRGLLQALRSDWRARFGADSPLLVVQLPGYGMPATQPTESGWAELREAQRRVAGEDPLTGLAVTIDIGDRYDVHPPNKQELGRRLARVARHAAYGERLPPSGPVPRSAWREDDAVVVRFGDIDDGLVAYGADGPIGFELCAAGAGTCRYASARIDGDRVRLRASSAPAATRVRYCWADSPICTLYDATGLPAGPFEMQISTEP
ncbi:sialate O-acetylesterase [Luteimonas sp. R10]|uniref:sialate O-acetylesterase n=1 Tax=Luteimonas sp. R10 TaxID=3108176 RepID=UPI00308E2137|nr:sialate O-acetylesterase [Luteimonas sp. R10]